MKVSQEVKDFIGQYSDLINDGEFENLFNVAQKLWGTVSPQIRELADLITAAGIDKDLEQHLPSMTRVYRNTVGRGVTFVGWNYDDDGEDEDDKEFYTSLEGKHGTIQGVAVVADYEGKYASTADAENYTDSYWDVLLDDSTPLCVSGLSLELDD